jgi:CheY-like chemotaxis protein
MGAVRMLLVEDSDDDALLLEKTLVREKLDVEIHRVADEAALRSALEAGNLDVVVVDWIVPGMSVSALEIIDIVAGVDPDLPVILVSGVLREEDAVQALRSGACDFVVKSRLSRLAPAIRREAAAAARRRAERALRERVAVVERLACVGVLARSLVHDLNGGLAVFSSNVEYALDAENAKESVEALRDARAAASRLAETVESLRAFTSVGEGAAVLDVQRVLSAAVRLVKVGIGSELSLDLAEVPPVQASEALVIQLFYTLLLAAVGEGARGPSAPAVKVVLRPDADGMKLSVGPMKSRNLEAAEQLARDVWRRRSAGASRSA